MALNSARITSKGSSRLRTVLFVLLEIGALATGAVMLGSPPPVPTDIDTTGSVPCCPWPLGGRSQPTSIAFDARTHTIYFFDLSYGVLQALTPAGAVRTVAGGCARDETYGGCYYQNSVDGIGSHARFEATQQMAYDPADDAFYVSEQWRIRRVSSSGVVTTIADSQYSSPDRGVSCASGSDPGGHEQLCNAVAISCDPDDNSVRIIEGCGVMRTVSASGLLTTLSMPAPRNPRSDLDNPTGFVYGPHGRPAIAFSDHWIATLARNWPDRILAGCLYAPPNFDYDYDCKDQRDGRGVHARFGGISGIAYDPDDGNLYVADESTVRRVSPRGNVETIAGGMCTTKPVATQCVGFLDGWGTTARFDGLGGIVYDPDDHSLYVTDRLNGAIRRVTPRGQVTTVARLYGTALPPPAHWSGDYATGDGYEARVWVDGDYEQERLYRYGTLFDIRFGQRNETYPITWLVFNLSIFRGPWAYETFYRVGPDTAAMPPIDRTDFARCPTALVTDQDWRRFGLRVLSGTNNSCLTRRIVRTDGTIVYSEYETNSIPHDPTLFVVRGK